eukprot:388189-Pelagomonas_calceolata.AAC.5
MEKETVLELSLKVPEFLSAIDSRKYTSVFLHYVQKSREQHYIGNGVLVLCQFNPNLQFKVVEWKSWVYTDDSCQVPDGKTVVGAGVYHPMSDSKM